MDKSNRPVGRQKRVGSGSGNVQRRGSGLSGRTGGPVGSSGAIRVGLEARQETRHPGVIHPAEEAHLPAGAA